MSDLISKSELIKEINKLLESPYANQQQLGRVRKEVIEIIRDVCVKKQPTAYDIDEVVEELELESFKFGKNGFSEKYVKLSDAIEIVKQGCVESEYNNGWIPCSERLPEEAFGCLVTVMDSDPVTLTDFENILPYFVGYDGHGWNDINGETIPFEVIAWMPLPECWKGEKYKE